MKPLRTFALAAVLAAAGGPASAQEPDRSKPDYWLTKMQALVGQPVQADLELSGRSMMLKMTGSGRLVFADSGHFRMEQMLQQHVPNMPEPKSASILLVADGTTLWVEQNETYLKRPQVQKIPLRMVAQFQDPGSQYGFGGTDADPVKQALQIVKSTDFASATVGNGEVVLRGQLKPEAVSALTEMLQEDPRELVLVLDEKTAFPIRRELIDARRETIQALVYRNVQHPPKDQIDPAQFAYAPPADHNLIDVEKLARERAAAPAQKPNQ